MGEGRSVTETPSWVGDAFERARSRLGADAVYYVEFVDNAAAVRLVAGEGALFGVYPGRTVPAEDTLALVVGDSQALMVVPDTSADDVARRLLSGGRRAPGAFVGVPARLASGDVFGVICAAFADPRPTMTRPDADVLAFLADIVAIELARLRGMRELRDELRSRVQGAMAEDTLRCVFQPIIDLRGNRTIGVEALSRFHMDPPRSPAVWFAEAHRIGVGIDLELAAIRAAARAARGLPDDVYVSVNASPSTLTSPAFSEALEGIDPARLVVEVTEHAAVSSYPQVTGALADVRAAGGRLAIDDLGSGFAGLNHLTGLRPDIIKIDRSVVEQAVHDASHHSLLLGMVAFASNTGAHVVAEGVETIEQLDVVADCRVDAAQGYVFSRPEAASSIRSTYQPSDASDTHGVSTQHSDAPLDIDSTT